MTEMIVSVTELGRFLRCRRQWWIASSNGMSLVKKGPPQQRYYIGTAFHKACELNALEPADDPLEATSSWLDTETAKIEEKYRAQTGALGLSTEEYTMLDESRELILGLVSGYFDKYGTTNPIAPLTYVAPEVSFKIPILSDRPVYLVGTLDGVAVDEFGGLWIAEHKTYSPGRAKKAIDMETDAQTMGYAYALWRLTGIMPTGVMYDGVAKVVPKQPKVLKNGKLSVDKTLVTTYKLYVQAILDNGEDPDDRRFTEILEKLVWQDHNNADPFFTRYMVNLKYKAIETFERNLLAQVRDMWTAREDEEKRYPNFPWNGCGDCDYRDVCQAMQFQEDVDNVVATAYTVGTYGTLEGLKDLSPQTVTDVESLKIAIAKRRGV